MPKGKGAAAAFEQDAREVEKASSEAAQSGNRVTRASGRLDQGDELERVNITLPTRILNAADQEVLRRKMQGNRRASRSHLIQEALEKLLNPEEG
jgi:transcriptional regulator of met regulon